MYPGTVILITDNYRQNLILVLFTDNIITTNSETPTKYRQLLFTDKYRQQDGQRPTDYIYNRQNTDKYHLPTTKFASTTKDFKNNELINYVPYVLEGGCIIYKNIQKRQKDLRASYTVGKILITCLVLLCVFLILYLPLIS